jgi:tryptophanyl-tRNA synthetase
MPETAISSSRPRVLSGMRPTGKLHLGNYMGALANWVKLQDRYECYFFIADLHALTTDYADTSGIAPNSLEVALDFLAAGLDPEQCTIFVQSHVKPHFELPLFLGMIAPLGWLERVPSYKEQQENLSHKDLTTYGFLGYPLLMASDILLYQAEFVPVGQDQQAHVEFTREVARRFNFLYPRDPRVKDAPIVSATREEIRQTGKEEAYIREHPGADPSAGLNYRVGIPADVLWSPESIVLPEPKVLLTPSPKLPGTDGRKMSKSYGNTILLTDPEPVVRQKLKTMVTDPARVRRTDPGDPDKCPVGDLHKVFSTPETLANVYEGCRTAGIGCIQCKSWAADALVQVLAPIQKRRAGYSDAQVKEILEDGSNRARVRAEQTMVEVRTAMQLSSV